MLRTAAETALSRQSNLADPLAMAPWLERVVDDGFVVGIVDIRGTGASFGIWPGPFSLQEAEDAYDVIEALAHAPWCSGAVGLVGRSYMGANQFGAALQRPPSLIGLFSEMAPFDIYHLVHQNGVFREDFARSWSDDIALRDNDADALPVDEDEGGWLLKAARAQHRDNPDIFGRFRAARFRDSRCVDTGVLLYEAFNPAHHMVHGTDHGLPTYILSGWHDINSADALFYQATCRGPVKMVIGPWAHGGSFGIDLGEECIAWYRGLLAQSPRDQQTARTRVTHYCQMSGGGPAQWYEAARPDFAVRRLAALYLESSGEASSGRLVETMPRSQSLVGPRGADPDATSGLSTRWSNGYGGPFGYDDLRALARAGMALTSLELQRPLELVGTPILELEAAETTAAVLFFFLADIHPDGFTQYVTEGALALTHRRLNSPIYNTGGRPFHRGNADDMLPAGCVTARLCLAMMPVAWSFLTGHRIQLIVTAADRGNAELTACRQQQFAFRCGPVGSRINLPIDTAEGTYFAIKMPP